MSGTKPNYRMVVWDKENKRLIPTTFQKRDGTTGEGPLSVMAGWDNDRGRSWKLERGWSLHGPDGEVIHADEVSLFERSTEFRGRPGPDDDDGNIPF